jgi:hypothetical protein
MEDVKRQARRVVLPVAMLTEYLVRTAPEALPQARLLEIHSDVRTRCVILHLETKTDQVRDEAGHPVPLDHAVNWDEVFGVIPCEASGEMTQVEDITVSRKTGMQMKSELDKLAKFLLEHFDGKTEFMEAEGSAVDVAIRLLSAK